jgi:hypothetical protein
MVLFLLVKALLGRRLVAVVALAEAEAEAMEARAGLVVLGAHLVAAVVVGR